MNKFLNADNEKTIYNFNVNSFDIRAENIGRIISRRLKCNLELKMKDDGSYAVVQQ